MVADEMFVGNALAAAPSRPPPFIMHAPQSTCGSCSLKNHATGRFRRGRIWRLDSSGYSAAAVARDVDRAGELTIRTVREHMPGAKGYFRMRAQGEGGDERACVLRIAHCVVGA